VYLIVDFGVVLMFLGFEPVLFFFKLSTMAALFVVEEEDGG
jgi:hypothetical protein